MTSKLPPLWKVRLIRPLRIPIITPDGITTGRHITTQDLGPFHSKYAAKVAVRRAGIDGQISPA